MGVRLNPPKLEAIQDIQSLAKFTQVRSFLGLAGYYRRFNNDFSGKAAVLLAVSLTKKNFAWGELVEEAFRALKEALTSPPFLAFTEFEGPSILELDASFMAVGAVLSPKQPDGRIDPFQYANRTMKMAENSYEVYQRKALAVVFGLLKFHVFFYQVTLSSLLPTACL